MFTMVLGIAASVLYLLPYDMDALANKASLKVLIQVYCLFVGNCILVSVVYISICLAFHLNASRLPSWPEQWKRSFQKLDKKKQFIVQSGLWTILIGSLLTGLTFGNLMAYNRITGVDPPYFS